MSPFNNETDPAVGNPETARKPSLVVIADNEVNGKIFEEGLADKIEDGVLVNVDSGDQKRENERINAAVELVKDNKPLILYGFLSRGSFNLDPKFQYLLGHKNCSFLRLPVTLDDFATENRRVKEKIDDPNIKNSDLALSLLDIDLSQEQTLSHLNHDLGNAKRSEDDEKFKTVMEEARSAGYKGTDEEIVKAIEDAKFPEYSPFVGRRFDGVFVDAEGTLLQDGQVNQTLVAKLKEAEKTGQEITIWTGGDMEKLAETLRKNGIPWKILPKNIFGGATVETAIDDLSAEELEKTYGFKAEKLEQV